MVDLRVPNMNPRPGGFDKNRVSSTFKHAHGSKDIREKRGFNVNPGFFGISVLIILVLIVFSSVFLFVFQDAFNNDPLPSDYVYIYYKLNNDSEDTQVRFLKTESFYLDESTPTKEGYHFAGWYLNDTLTEPLNPNALNVFPIQRSLTLYAKWIPENSNVNITFNTLDGDSLASITVPSGTRLDTYIPTHPTKQFYGWYLDPNFKEPVLTVPNVDTTLYALWLDANLLPIGSYDTFYRLPFGRQYRTIQGGYYLSDTEVTYGLWKTIYDYAIIEGYIFSSMGTPVNSLEYEPVTIQNEQLPVVNITPMDILVWLNAYSEYLGLQSVYYHNQQPLKNANRVLSQIEIKNHNGMRLPTNLEWEFASRYTTESNETLSFIDRNQYYLFNSTHSGMTSSFSETGDEVRWYAGNASGLGHPVGQKSPNTFGLFDMSGNVTEFVLTPQPLAFYSRGDHFLMDGSISTINYPESTTKNNHSGFRIAFGFTNFMIGD